MPDHRAFDSDRPDRGTPDFSQLVRDRLPLPVLARRDGDSVLEEIAAQMEDCYQDARVGGATEDEAIAAALELIEDWDALAGDIVSTVGTHRSAEADQWIEDREEELRAKAGRFGEALADLDRDLRLAVRMLLRRPGFTVMAILSLAVGLGAATTIFSLTNGLLFKPLSIEDPESAVIVYKGEGGNHSYLDYMVLKEACEPFMELAARDEFFYGQSSTKPLFLRAGPVATRIKTGMVTGNYFSLLGIRPAAGRLLLPDDNRTEGGRAVAVLSWDFWQRQYDGDVNVVGREADLSGTIYTIVGIAERGFTGTIHESSVDVWIPAVMRRMVDAPEVRYDIVTSDMNWVEIIGRLRPGITIEQAQSRLDAVVTASDRLSESLKEHTARLKPLGEAAIAPWQRDSTITYLTVLMLAVGLMVLVVGVNVTNLYAGRLEERGVEISVRRALGAGSGTLLRQFLLECGLVTLAGGAGALILSIWFDDVVFTMLAQGLALSGTAADVTPDLRVLGFTLGLVFACTLAMAFVAAVRNRQADISRSLRPGDVTIRTSHRFLTLQNLLVAGQITLSLVLLTGAGLLLQSVIHLQAQDPGLDTQNTLIVSVDNEHLPLDDQAGADLYNRILERIRGVPGVEAVAITRIPPLAGRTWSMTLIFEGYEAAEGERTGARENFVDAGFFDMMGIRLLQGRGFTGDDIIGSEPVAIVNEALVRRYWPETDPLGKTIEWWSSDGTGEVFRVIGVVNDHFYAHLREGVRPVAYYPITQYFLKNPVLLVRTTSNPYEKISIIRAAVRDIDPRLNLWNEISFEDQIRATGSKERAATILLFTFAGIALLLALIGTYGVIAGFVTRRRREIGIRIALGARSQEVMRYIIGLGMRLVIIGVVAGLVLALLATRILASLVFGVGTTDPVTLIAVSLVLAVAGAAACLSPARRAVRIDPIEILKAD